MRGGMLWFNFKRSLPILKRSAGFRGFRRWPKYTVPFQHFPSLSSFNILYLSRNCFRNGSQWWLPAPLWKFSWFHSIAAETHPFHFHNKTERNMENQKVVCIRKSVVRGHREMRLLEILPSLFLCYELCWFHNWVASSHKMLIYVLQLHWWSVVHKIEAFFLHQM